MWFMPLWEPRPRQAMAFGLEEDLPSGRLGVVCEADRDGGVAPTGGCLHFVGAPPSGRWVVVCEAFRDEGVAPTREGPAFVSAPSFCGSPALGAMGCGLRGFSRRGRRSYRGDALYFVGAPPSGRWLVVCEAFRDEGVAPTQKSVGMTLY